MKDFLKYILTIIVLFIVLFVGTILAILKCSPGTFYESYQSFIVDEYRALQNTNEPKIIFVGGSSAALGLNQKMLEDATGYKVINLGLHAGFGNLFPSELAKENINEGDIVLLGYEYTWKDDLSRLDQSLIMSGIDDNIDLYKHIPIERWPEFIGYIFTYASKKNNWKKKPAIYTIYSRNVFDKNTRQLTLERNYVMDYENNKKSLGNIDLKGSIIAESVKKYLIDYKNYIENEGADIYFVSPPILKRAISCNYSDFDLLKEQEEKTIGIPYISNPEDYFFEDDLMYDSIYHCSSEGEKVRTQLLIDDLKKANVI